jgi:Na+:H+ antiporter, NhaA family
MQRVYQHMREFIQSESAGGILLVCAAVLAMIAANSPAEAVYRYLVELPVQVRVGPVEIAKPLLLWVNDGLMAVFFFLVGLELKRELLEGELADRKRIALPALGAIGGMAVPAMIYAAVNWGDAVAMRGWAIPTATDIAFALGVLSLFGSRVPNSLKVLLTSLAIFDDLGAILIIAAFYTDSISTAALGFAGCCLALLLIMNRRGQEAISPYIFVGIIMWISLLKSGVHATLAGVILAFFIPLRSRHDCDHSPLGEIEHDLHPVVSLYILPIFAFCNSGINLADASADFLLHGVPLGIALGLFFGKQFGIFALLWLGIRLRLAAMPEGCTWQCLYGMSALCGIGYTMSLFIGSLAFDQTITSVVFDERLGIILGSLLSAVLGTLILRKALPET